MVEEITFKKVEEQYQKSRRYMNLNEQLMFDVDNRPKHATWIHNPTLARWFYQASQEWLKEYKDKVKSFTDQGYVVVNINEVHKLAVGNPRSLNAILERFRDRIRNHPEFSQDKLVMEMVR